jgi:ribonuclease PH
VVVRTSGEGELGIVEVQGTAEGAAFSRAELNQLLDLAEHGARQLFAAQNSALSQ